MIRLILGLVVLTTVCFADMAPAPHVFTVTCRSGHHLARIYPAYLEKKQCYADMFKLNEFEDKYEKFKTIKLKNKMSPANAIISVDGGFLVTVDDHGSRGRGNNVIVCYNLKTDDIVNFSLSDFVSIKDMSQFTRSTSNTFWWNSNSLKAKYHNEISLDYFSYQLKVPPDRIVGYTLYLESMEIEVMKQDYKLSYKLKKDD